MKKGIFVLFVLLVFSNILLALDPADYFPLAVGNSWTTIDSSEDGYDTTTAEVPGTTNMDGYFTYLFVEEDGYGGSDTTYFQFRPDGLYRYEELMDGPDLVSILMVPDPFNIGDDWEIFTYDTVREDSSFTDSIHMEMTGYAVSFESVTVPAGTFNNTLKWQMSMNYGFYRFYGGMVVYSDTGSMGKHIIWVAEGVGPVKNWDSEIDEGDTTITSSVLLYYDFTSIDEPLNSLPSAISLEAYPNPFNASVRINAPYGSTLKVFDINGTLINSWENCMNNEILWEPELSVSSGIYLIRASMGNNSVTQKIIYIQ